MPSPLRASSSIFNGIILIAVGVLLLLHNYRGLELSAVLRWWPLLLIVWGATRLYERTAGNRPGDPGTYRSGTGEKVLVALAVVAIVALVELSKDRIGTRVEEFSGDTHEYVIDDVEPQGVPANARIVIRSGRGDVTVRSSDEPEVRVSGQVSLHSWRQSEADRIAKPISAEIVQNGDGYEIRPRGFDTSNTRIRVDLEVVVPSKASITIRNGEGDVSVSGMLTPVTINNVKGDVELRDITGDVDVAMHNGDVKVSDTKGNIKISGKGGQVDVSDATGGLTLNGEFFGPIRADKIAKGVRFISQRTDLTLTQLSGHLEAGSGNLEISDTPGNLALRTDSYDVTIEDAGGKVKLDSRNGAVELRFSNAPKEDIDISNSSAGITLVLPESSSFEINADCHSGDIDSEFEADSLKKTSTSGDSHLNGKYGSGRGPRITLKTSYGSISLRKTS